MIDQRQFWKTTLRPIHILTTFVARELFTATIMLLLALVTLAAILITPIYLAKFTNGETLGLAVAVGVADGGDLGGDGGAPGQPSGRALRDRGLRLVVCGLGAAVRHLSLHHPARDAGAPHHRRR